MYNTHLLKPGDHVRLTDHGDAVVKVVPNDTRFYQRVRVEAPHHPVDDPLEVYRRDISVGTPTDTLNLHVELMRLLADMGSENDHINRLVEELKVALTRDRLTIRAGHLPVEEGDE